MPQTHLTPAVVLLGLQGVSCNLPYSLTNLTFAYAAVAAPMGVENMAGPSGTQQRSQSKIKSRGKVKAGSKENTNTGNANRKRKNGPTDESQGPPKKALKPQSNRPQRSAGARGPGLAARKNTLV